MKMKFNILKFRGSTVKAVLREKFMALKLHIRKKRSQINNLRSHLENLEKEE